MKSEGIMEVGRLEVQKERRKYGCLYGKFERKDRSTEGCLKGSTEQSMHGSL